MEAGRTSRTMRSEAGAQSQRDQASDRVGGEVVVTPCAAHESALITVEERGFFIGDVADIERKRDALERVAERELLRQMQIERVRCIDGVAAAIRVAVLIPRERTTRASTPVLVRADVVPEEIGREIAQVESCVGASLELHR